MDRLRNSGFLCCFLLYLSCLGNCERKHFRTRVTTSIRSNYYEFYKYSEPTIATRSDQVYRRSSPSRRIDDSSILFPSSVLTLPNPGSIISTGGPDRNNIIGTQCILFGGSIGACKPAAQCIALLQRHQLQIMQSQSLVRCGDRNGLICCPESPASTPAIEISEPAKSKPATTLKPIPTQTIQPTNPPPKVQLPPTPEAIVHPPIPETKPVQNIGLPRPKPNEAPAPKQNFDFSDTEEVQNVCGVYTEDKEGGNKTWPWTVSIGRKFDNGSIEWTCLGSLITKEFILTAAVCLQQNSNVIAVGKTFLGLMSSSETRGVDIHRISQVLTHEKFNSPYLYKNIGLLQISSPIFVTPSQLPVCFPFLASVLDIITFTGTQGKTIGFDIPVRRKTGVTFGFQEYRVLNNSQCAKIFIAQQQHVSKRFPFGIKNDNMCAIQRNPGTLCQAPGAPFVIFDTASSTYVQIGVSSGDPSCAELRRQIVTFSRLSFFSKWVRERVGQLPTPPTCYF